MTSSKRNGHTESISPDVVSSWDTCFRKLDQDHVLFSLAFLHPRDGLSLLWSCRWLWQQHQQHSEILWKMWAFVLWPKDTVSQAVPFLYPGYEHLVRDENRLGAVHAVRWPDKGCEQRSCLWRHNCTSRFYGCCIMAGEFKAWTNELVLHVEVRGEFDLRIPSKLCLVLSSSGQPDRYLATAIAQASFISSTPDGGTAESEGRGHGGRSGQYRKASLVYQMTFADDVLQRPETLSEISNDDEFRIVFMYAASSGGRTGALVALKDYCPVVLWCWAASEKLTFAQAFSKFHNGGKHRIFPRNEFDLSVKSQDGHEAKSKRFAFVPEAVKARSGWWI